MTAVNEDQPDGPVDAPCAPELREPEWVVKFRAMAIAAVEREQAEMDARNRVGRLRPQHRHGANGASSVFTLRIDHEERSALEARADVLGLKPSVLARNFIRVGLQQRPAPVDDDLLDE